jgi:transposase
VRYELTDHELTAIKPMLPNKPRAMPRVNDGRVLNGIFWVLRSGAPLRDLPKQFGPYTTCYKYETELDWMFLHPEECGDDPLAGLICTLLGRRLC